VGLPCGTLIGTTCASGQHSAHSHSLPSILQGKAESFALYQQQFSVGVGVLISLITACVVGYYVGRHFIDVNNKAGVRARMAGSEIARVLFCRLPRIIADSPVRQLRYCRRAKMLPSCAGPRESLVSTRALPIVPSR
jgi:hypothetical protein